RIRLHKPIELILSGSSMFLDEEGVITEEDGRVLLTTISKHSLYIFEEELKRGYITIAGGHRIGITGKVVTEGGEVKMIRDISSYNIRIAKQMIGSAQPLMSSLISADHSIYNTLIISSPQCGKTTLLRDLARILSYGHSTLGLKGHKVGIVDERSELAGSIRGIPQHDVGPRTDVLDACPKAEGMMMLIRSMSPDVLIVDEIGRQADGEAVQEAINAGVKLITSVHGTDLNDILKRPIMERLVQQAAFGRYVVLSRKHGVGTIEEIYDESLQKVARGKAVMAT
ncbi:MAG: stage III sporulation protein AA, partial [Bacilli bacterium]